MARLEEQPVQFCTTAFQVKSYGKKENSSAYKYLQKINVKVQ